MSLSTLGKIGMADKLSVAQLQQAVKAGSIPAYIGIPLIQEKVKEEQDAKAALAAQNTPQNSVAEQVMAQATQQEMSGLGDLQTNLPEQYASGGIIGYADGGDIDPEDYAEQLEDAEFDAYARAMINRTPSVEKGLRNAPSISYSQVQGAAPRNAPAAAGGIDSLIEKYAAKHGVPVDLARNIAMAEGGGKMNLSGDPRSSARGPFGIIDSTWKSLGGTAENRNDPEANVDLGIKLIRQNAEAMKGKLGQDPSYGNVYAAHHFGSGVSNMLAKANPKESIEEGLSRFESPSRIKAIMQANPHLRGKTVGEVESFLNKKGGQGIYALAHGGEVKRFAEENGDQLVTDDDNRTRWDMLTDWLGKRDPNSVFAGTSERFQKNAESGGPFATGSAIHNYFMAKPNRGEGTLKGLTDAELAQKEAEGRENATYNWPSRSIGSYQGYPTAAEAIAARDKDLPPKAPAPAVDTGKGSDNPKVEGTTTETKPSPWQELRDQIAQSQERRKQQKEQDMWLALMAGGLGTMAGTSQYAGVNLGQGAMHGLQQYGLSRREAAKDEAADLKTMANIARYEGMDKYYSDLSEANAAKNKDYVEVKNKEIAANALARKDADIIREAKARYGDKIEMMSPADQAAFNKFIEAQKATPGYMELQNTLYGDLNKFKVLR